MSSCSSAKSAKSPEPAFSSTLELDLSTVVPSLAGPRRPQDRVPLRQSKQMFESALVFNGRAWPHNERLTLAQGDGTYPTVLARFARVDMLILDDWGLVGLKDAHRQDLLEILESLLPAAMSEEELAAAILEDCRRFSGGDLSDDCAIVCLKLAR